MFANLKNGELKINTSRNVSATATTQEDLVKAFLNGSEEELTATIDNYVEYDGKTYLLTQQAYCDNYGTDGAVRYYAHAIDSEGNNYKVAWDTTETYDLMGELYRLDLKQQQQPEDFNDEDQERMNEICEELDFDIAKSSPVAYIEDESNACDWDNPVDVKEV